MFYTSCIGDCYDWFGLQETQWQKYLLTATRVSRHL